MNDNDIKDVLIIVDMQNDFIYGSLGSNEAQNIVDNVVKKIKQYNRESHQIFATRDTHIDSNYLSSHEGRFLPVKHCIYDTHGWNIVDEVSNELQPKTIILNKSSFGRQYWEDFISPKQSIEIVGVCTDICVISNALILRSRFPESDIFVDSSCCAGTTPEMHEKALDVMKSCHIQVI